MKFVNGLNGLDNCVNDFFRIAWRLLFRFTDQLHGCHRASDKYFVVDFYGDTLDDRSCRNKGVWRDLEILRSLSRTHGERRHILPMKYAIEVGPAGASFAGTQHGAGGIRRPRALLLLRDSSFCLQLHAVRKTYLRATPLTASLTKRQSLVVLVMKTVGFNSASSFARERLSGDSLHRDVLFTVRRKTKYSRASWRSVCSAGDQFLARLTVTRQAEQR